MDLLFFVVPTSPYNFTIIKISSSSVQFSWLTNDSEITSNFIIERRSKSDWVTINSLVISPWYEDQNLPPFTAFMYRVSAKNVLGTSKLGRSFNASTKEGGRFCLEIHFLVFQMWIIIDHRNNSLLF